MPDLFHHLTAQSGALCWLGFRAGAVFVVRHWVFGVLNLGLTALLGLGLLRLISWLGLLQRGGNVAVRLTQLVLLCALAKGAFYLVLGDNRGIRLPNAPFAWGLQIPDIRETLFLIHQTSNSIWRPTKITLDVTTALCGLAFLLLLRRAWQLRQASRALDMTAKFEGRDASPKLQALMKQAAISIGLSPQSRLPHLTLVELPQPSPLLLGIFHPRILLSPRLVQRLSDEEMEMVLRHELAHFRRGDNVWRWLQVWVEDVSRVNLGISLVGAWAIDQEERLCDRLAIRCAQDAKILSHAIVKVTQLPAVPAEDMTPLPEFVIPSLMGRHWQRRWNPGSLPSRLKDLLSIADERNIQQQKRNQQQNQRGSRPQVPDGIPARPLRLLWQLPIWGMRLLLTLLLSILLLGVVCLKFRLLFNLHGLG